MKRLGEVEEIELVQWEHDCIRNRGTVMEYDNKLGKMGLGKFVGNNEGWDKEEDREEK
jgi:hypothetical protein